MLFSLWVFLSLLVGYFAGKKGRSPGNWFFISLFISPLIAGFLLLIGADISEQENFKNGVLKKCLYCAEPIKREAVKCKHCGADLPAVG